MKKKSILFAAVITGLFFTLTLQLVAVSGQSINKEHFINSKKSRINNLAQTPPMAWNSWNAFHTEITEKKIKDAA